jgi:hypothetical protein
MDSEGPEEAQELWFDPHEGPLHDLEHRNRAKVRSNFIRVKNISPPKSNMKVNFRITLASDRRNPFKVYEIFQSRV